MRILLTRFLTRLIVPLLCAIAGLCRAVARDAGDTILLLTTPITRRLGALTLAARSTWRQHGTDVFMVRPLQFAVAAILVLAIAAVHPAPAHAMSSVSTLTLTGLGISFMGIVQGDIASDIAAEVSETFKQVYVKAVDAVPDSNPLTAQLNRTRKFKGAPDALYFNVKLETGGKTANLKDGGLLPSPSRPKRKTGKSSLCHTYTVVAVGGQSIPLTGDTRNAFVSNLEEQFEDGMTRVKNDVERQYNGDGRGILCTLSAVGAAPQYTVANPYGAVGAGPGSMNLIESMDVAILNSADGTERGRATISTVDVDNDFMTLSSAVAGAAIGDFVVLCNDISAGAGDKQNNYLNESAGILAVCKDNDIFENVSGPLFRRWRASVMTVNGSMTEKIAATLQARIRTRSGKKPTLDYTTPGIILSVQESLAARRMNTGETIELKGGYEGLKLQNRSVLEGPWCPKGYYFQLNTSDDVVGMVDVVKMGYVDLDGAKLHRTEGRHAFRADLWFPHQAIWFERAVHGVAKGITDDNTIRR